jgi:hypothetical protein
MKSYETKTDSYGLPNNSFRYSKKTYWQHVDEISDDVLMREDDAQSFSDHAYEFVNESQWTAYTTACLRVLEYTLHQNAFFSLNKGTGVQYPNNICSVLTELAVESMHADVMTALCRKISKSGK